MERSTSKSNLSVRTIPITHRLFFLLLGAGCIISFISVYSASQSTVDTHHQITLDLDNKMVHNPHHKWNITRIPSLRTTISPDDNLNSSQPLPLDHPLAPQFTPYLDPLCLRESTYPPDCLQLLQSMINISISLQLTENEIHILSQRIQYLNTPHDDHIKQPVLYIHIPKTGGTGFGSWLMKFSSKQVVHYWIPDNMQPHMYDDNHFPNAERNRRLITGRQRIRTNTNTQHRVYKHTPKRNKRAFYPQAVYGHLAYGFDKLFLSPQQIQKLNQTPDSILWAPRVNYTYITILRHPTTRVPSHYFYHKSGKKDENNRWTRDKSLFEWVSWFEESSECLVQFLSGCHHRAWYNKKYRDILEPNLDPWPRREQVESPDVFRGMNITEDQYKIARNHLLWMGWVGLTEYLSESVEQFKTFWQSRTNRGSQRVNVHKRGSKSEIGQNVLDKIIKYNKYDIALWDLAYVMFLQQRIVIKYGYKRNMDEQKANAVHNSQQRYAGMTARQRINHNKQLRLRAEAERKGSNK